jgi:hypothetical protein
MLQPKFFFETTVYSAFTVSTVPIHVSLTVPANAATQDVNGLQ